MERRTPGRIARSLGGARGRGRVLGLVATLAVVGVALAGCSGYSPYSQIDPKTDRAEDIHFLYQIIFWAALVVFVGVQAAIVYVVLRYRRRNDDRPEQVHGNTRLEMAWTIIPAVILLAVFIPTAQIIYRHAAADEQAEFTVDVYGKQWWWEIHYPDIPVDPADEGQDGLCADAPGQPPRCLITANEVRLPANTDVVFNLRSNNVIHSFWVPQLSGKMDVIPGHDNQLSFTTREPGEYWGLCAEFCGTAHAWMRFKVQVMPQEEFDAWVEAWRQPPAVADANPSTPDVIDPPAAFGACLACHNINGTSARVAAVGINAPPNSVAAGPNLTLLACRDFIGAGVLENTEDGLRTWLKHTDDVKDGVYMPNYYENGTINDQQVEELIQYLRSLQPEGGCPPEYPVGGEIVSAGLAEPTD